MIGKRTVTFNKRWEKNIKRQCADYRKIRLSSGKVLCVICIIYSFFTPLFNHLCFFFFASCGQFPLIFEWIAHLRLLKENGHLAYFNCRAKSEQRCEAKLMEWGPFKVKRTYSGVAADNLGVHTCVGSYRPHHTLPLYTVAKLWDTIKLKNYSSWIKTWIKTCRSVCW